MIKKAFRITQQTNKTITQQISSFFTNKILYRPYQTNEDLPEKIKNVLPLHAQDIYREAFNHALKEYADPSKRKDNASLEATAARVAWSAVKKKYEKQGHVWVTKK